MGFTPLIRASRTFSRREKDLDEAGSCFFGSLFAEIPLPPGSHRERVPSKLHLWVSRPSSALRAPSPGGRRISMRQDRVSSGHFSPRSLSHRAPTGRGSRQSCIYGFHAPHPRFAHLLPEGEGSR